MRRRITDADQREHGHETQLPATPPDRRANDAPANDAPANDAGIDRGCAAGGVDAGRPGRGPRRHRQRHGVQHGRPVAGVRGTRLRRQPDCAHRGLPGGLPRRLRRGLRQRARGHRPGRTLQQPEGRARRRQPQRPARRRRHHLLAGGARRPRIGRPVMAVHRRRPDPRTAPQLPQAAGAVARPCGIGRKRGRGDHRPEGARRRGTEVDSGAHPTQLRQLLVLRRRAGAARPHDFGGILDRRHRRRAAGPPAPRSPGNRPVIAGMPYPHPVDAQLSLRECLTRTQLSLRECLTRTQLSLRECLTRTQLSLRECLTRTQLSLRAQRGNLVGARSCYANGIATSLRSSQ